jgi:phage terminase large subunit-like protein
MAANNRVTIDLPRLRRDQWAIVQHPAQIKVLSMGRRWGKTVLGGAMAISVAAAGGLVAWGAPEYKNTRPLWRMVESRLAPAQKAGLCRVLKADRMVEFSNGGFLGVYSLDNADSVLGEKFHLAIIDEAARVKPEAWHEALLPTLADYGGSALLISTPKPGWYRDEWQKARADGEYMAAFTAPTSDNPNPNIRQAFEMARERLPDRVFRQEWLAEFVNDSGQVFPRIRDAVYGLAENAPDAGSGQFVIGVDLAKTVDYSVFTVADVQRRRVVEIVRLHRQDYTLQIERLAGLAARYNAQAVIVETNNTGAPVIEQLHMRGLPVVPFTTTNATKAAIVNALVLAFEQGTIEIPDDEQLINELNAFEIDVLPSGLSRYSAPEGQHDDMVMSLAFAWWGITSASGAVTWIS